MKREIISEQIKRIIELLKFLPLMPVKEMGQIRQQIVYVPNHLMDEYLVPENWCYPNGIQPGFIYGYNKNNDYFCRYWQWDSTAGVYLPALRTLANSELTPRENIFYLNFFSNTVVNDAMKLLIGQPFSQVERRSDER
jgi:hypothetical protein